MTRLLIAAAFAALIASPALSQIRQQSGRYDDTVQQGARGVQPGSTAAKRAARQKPCAARTWAGCQGWDPDPNVRSMIQMDAGRDDQ